MTPHRIILVLMAALLCLGPATAQERTVTVGVPAGPLVQLVQSLGAAFRAETGIAVAAAEVKPDGPPSTAGIDAILLPRRILERLPQGGLPPRTVFRGDVVLVGSRAEMARVRGLKDIKTALRWIASARGMYMSSSPSLGTRDLELALWDGIGVNVQARSTWYVGSRGDEVEVLRQAGSLGAYLLIERMTWAAEGNRRGLEVLVAGDPILHTDYASSLPRDAREEAVAWHDWLSSDAAQAVIADFSAGGVRIFTPAKGGDGDGRPPRT